MSPLFWPVRSDVASTKAAACTERARSDRRISGVEAVEAVSAGRRTGEVSREFGWGGVARRHRSQSVTGFSLEISLAPEYRDPVSLEWVAEAVAALPDVEELAYGQEWVEAYSRAVSLVRTAVLGVGHRARVRGTADLCQHDSSGDYAREDELEILALVGASGTFIRVPFVIEGIVQGTGGGVLALGVLYLAFSLLLARVRRRPRTLDRQRHPSIFFHRAFCFSGVRGEPVLAGSVRWLRWWAGADEGCSVALQWLALCASLACQPFRGQFRLGRGSNARSWSVCAYRSRRSDKKSESTNAGNVNCLRSLSGSIVF